MREQMNAITAFIDGSNIYGSDDVTAALVRQGSGGQLAYTSTSSGNYLLPKGEGLNMQPQDCLPVGTSCVCTRGIFCSCTFRFVCRRTRMAITSQVTFA